MPFNDSVADDLPRAFPAHPRLDRFFASPSAKSARERIVSCLLRGDGPALLLGAAGVGKTMLVEVIARDVADRPKAKRLTVVQLAGAQLCTRRALLQSILHGLGQPFREHEEGELRLSLQDALRDKAISGSGVALLVDEAQSLPTRLLEELRLLANTLVEGAPRVRLLLAGSHALDEAFTAPELQAFSQRIAARCYLEPLSRAETADYVRAHIAASGGDPDAALTPDAYEAIALASDGLPRLINQVCDRAVVMAVAQGEATITGESISEAWSDLHQLAAPWHVPSARAVAAASSPSASAAEPPIASVEFGVLDEELDEPGAVSDVERSVDPPRAESAPALEADGVWNADQGLRSLPRQQAEPGPLADEEEDEGCVSYAFPVPQEEPNDAPLKPVAEPNEKRNEPDPTAFGAGEENAAGDPFAEAFDEEEVVLDPFAALERVIPAATNVTTAEPTDIGKALDAWNEVEVGGGLAMLEPPPSPTAAGFAVVDDAFGMDHDTELDPEEEASAAASPLPVEDEASHTDPMLVVEADDPEAANDVRRQDYAQLFASLRQG